MSFTVSHRQAGVTKANVAGLLRHEFRDVDKSNGVETQHSNERIIPERTHLNESKMYVDGQEVPLSHSSQIMSELERRLSTAGGTRTNKKTGKVTRIAVRDDARVVRDIVLQLDPVFTRSAKYLTSQSCPEEHRELVKKHLQTMIDFYGELYGRENLLASSLHLDETSPHVHLLVTPIDGDGRVRNASFIPDGRGPKSGMAKNDEAMRKHLAANGYDVDAKPRGINRSHMSVDEYAKYMQREEELAAREVELEDKTREVAEAALAAEKSMSDAEGAKRAANALEGHYRASLTSLRAREARLDEQIDENTRRSEQLDQAISANIESQRAFQTAMDQMRADKVIPSKPLQSAVTEARQRREAARQEVIDMLNNEPGSAKDRSITDDEPHR